MDNTAIILILRDHNIPYRVIDDRPIALKVKKPGDGRSKAPQFGRR